MRDVQSHAFVLWSKFLIVGALGFATEAAILQVLVGKGLAGPYLARCISFPVAVTLTWALNRRLTFVERPMGSSGLRYMLYVFGQIVAALANLGAYAALVFLKPRLAGVPVVALAGGAVVGLVINFCWADLVVFRREKYKG